MFELLRLVDFALTKSREGKELVLATIVHTIGSSYRKQGTQMIVADDLSYEGALSGGCVEKEVLRRAQTVFPSKCNVVFEYDGRYKLGCNGRIFILLEYLVPETLHTLVEKIRMHHETRTSFNLCIRRTHESDQAHTSYEFGNVIINVTSPDEIKGEVPVERVAVPPQFQIVIIGGEYDSTTLANMACDAGLRTFLIAKEMPPYRLSRKVETGFALPEALASKIRFDKLTAIVIMTHSLSKDMSYLRELIKVPSCYLGVLGPDHRKKTILNDLMNMDERLFFQYQDKFQEVRGPMGLGIGAVTPEEISVSILAEVIASLRQSHLKDAVAVDSIR